jgi:hypothetical protein
VCLFLNFLLLLRHNARLTLDARGRCVAWYRDCSAVLIGCDRGKLWFVWDVIAVTSRAVDVTDTPTDEGEPLCIKRFECTVPRCADDIVALCISADGLLAGIGTKVTSIVLCGGRVGSRVLMK